MIEKCVNRLIASYAIVSIVAVFVVVVIYLDPMLPPITPPSWLFWISVAPGVIIGLILSKSKFPPEQ